MREILRRRFAAHSTNRCTSRSSGRRPPSGLSFGSWDALDPGDPAVVSCVTPTGAASEPRRTAFASPQSSATISTDGETRSSPGCATATLATVVVHGFPPGSGAFIRAAHGAGIGTRVVLHSSMTQHGAEAGEAAVAERSPRTGRRRSSGSRGIREGRSRRVVHRPRIPGSVCAEPGAGSPVVRAPRRWTGPQRRDLRRTVLAKERGNPTRRRRLARRRYGARDATPGRRIPGPSQHGRPRRDPVGRVRFAPGVDGCQPLRHAVGVPPAVADRVVPDGRARALCPARPTCSGATATLWDLTTVEIPDDPSEIAKATRRLIDHADEASKTRRPLDRSRGCDRGGPVARVRLVKAVERCRRPTLCAFARRGSKSQEPRVKTGPSLGRGDARCETVSCLSPRVSRLA